MATKKKTPAPETEVTAYKGFDKNLQCRGFQYEVGKTFVHDGEVKACESGFHACEHPLNVFSYYAPFESRFAKVKLSGAISRESGGDTKIAAAKITIETEIKIHELVADAVKFVFDRAKWLKRSISNKDEHGVTSTGYQGAASSTGYRGAASSTGDQGAASSTGYQGAASSTGDRGAASSTGYQGAASSTGDQGAAMASGYMGKVMGANGSAMFLVERDDSYNILNVWAGIAGKDGIKENVFYTLKNGIPEEVL